jgi:hypothetical protein
MREMILTLFGRSWAFQKKRAVLNELSLASAPPLVKKKVLIDG